jgi:hypothetical protein
VQREVPTRLSLPEAWWQSRRRISAPHPQPTGRPDWQAVAPQRACQAAALPSAQPLVVQRRWIPPRQPWGAWTHSSRPVPGKEPAWPAALRARSRKMQMGPAPMPAARLLPAPRNLTRRAARAAELPPPLAAGLLTAQRLAGLPRPRPRRAGGRKRSRRRVPGLAPARSSSPSGCAPWRRARCSRAPHPWPTSLRSARSATRQVRRDAARVDRRSPGCARGPAALSGLTRATASATPLLPLRPWPAPRLRPGPKPEAADLGADAERARAAPPMDPKLPQAAVPARKQPEPPPWRPLPRQLRPRARAAPL